jgi:hypothetical protein
MTFSTAKIRVESELRGEAYPPPIAGESPMPEFNVLDNVALKRCLSRTRAKLTEAEARCRFAEAERDLLYQRHQQELAEAEARRRKAEAERDLLRYSHAEELVLRCQRGARELDVAAIDTEQERLEKTGLQAEVLALRASSSWRITKPLRSIADAVKGLTRFLH